MGRVLRFSLCLSFKVRFIHPDGFPREQLLRKSLKLVSLCVKTIRYAIWYVHKKRCLYKIEKKTISLLISDLRDLGWGYNVMVDKSVVYTHNF